MEKNEAEAASGNGDLGAGADLAAFQHGVDFTLGLRLLEAIVPFENLIRGGLPRTKELGHARGRWLRSSGCLSRPYAIVLCRAGGSKRR